MRRILRFDEGFSLIELLVALAILGVVAAIIVPQFLNVQQSAQAAVVTSDIGPEVQNAYNSWLSLGGSLSGTAPINYMSAFIQLISQPSPRSAPMVVSVPPAGVATATDSVGPSGSSCVSLNLPVSVITVETQYPNFFNASLAGAGFAPINTSTYPPGFYCVNFGNMSTVFYVTQSGRVYQIVQPTWQNSQYNQIVLQ